MKASFFFLLLMFCVVIAKPQERLSDAYHHSVYTMIFQLAFGEAFRVYQGYVLPDTAECFKHKVDSFFMDSGLQNKVLKPGYYVFACTHELNINYQFYHVPYLHVKTFGVNRDLELRVYDPYGNLVADARVFDEKKEIAMIRKVIVSNSTVKEPGIKK